MLQSAVEVNGNDTITGTLNYVTGYTGFSSDVAEQSGNFLALAFDSADGTTIAAKIGERGPVDLTTDKYLVVRLEDEDLADKLVITATKSDTTTVKEFDLSRLVLATE